MEMFNNFIEEYPDYGPYGKFKLSHSRFYRWLDSYGEFKYEDKPVVTRRSQGKFVEFIKKEEEQVKLNF